MTRLLRFNANLTVHYWHLRRQMPLTPKATTGEGAQKHSRRNFTVCRNHTNLVFLPIAFFCGSPTCQLSKCLTTILQPLTDKSRRKLQSTEDFISATKTVKIPDNYKLVSFYVKSLLQVFHFKWNYNVLRLRSENLPTLYRCRQRTLWTY